MRAVKFDGSRFEETNRVMVGRVLVDDVLVGSHPPLKGEAGALWTTDVGTVFQHYECGESWLLEVGDDTSTPCPICSSPDLSPRGQGLETVTLTVDDLEVLGQAIIFGSQGESASIYDTILAVSDLETADRLWALFVGNPSLASSPRAPAVQPALADDKVARRVEKLVAENRRTRLAWIG